jgi:hypothetical protein
MPLPENPCGQFVEIPTSNDCVRGGRCDTLDGGFGFKTDQCLANRFCVSGPIEVPLIGSAPSYRAAASGRVLFGWDDRGTAAEGLPPAVYDAEVGPTGMRAIAAGFELALECTMGVREEVPDGMGGLTGRWVPAPDSALISFPIQPQ